MFRQSQILKPSGCLALVRTIQSYLVPWAAKGSTTPLCRLGKLKILLGMKTHSHIYSSSSLDGNFWPKNQFHSSQRPKLSISEQLHQLDGFSRPAHTTPPPHLLLGAETSNRKKFWEGLRNKMTFHWVWKLGRLSWVFECRELPEKIFYRGAPH